jgi:hypothetical protein
VLTTDFKIGVTIQYLRAHGYCVFAEYEEVKDRYAAEQERIVTFTQHGFRLLNAPALPGYNYRTADRVEEQRRVEEFIAGTILEPCSEEFR